MKYLTTLYRAEEAEMLAELLRNNQIAVLLQGENFSALYPVTIAKMSEIRLFVREHEYETAADLMHAFFQGESPAPEEQMPPTDPAE